MQRFVASYSRIYPAPRRDFFFGAKIRLLCLHILIHVNADNLKVLRVFLKKPVPVFRMEAACPMRIQRVKQLICGACCFWQEPFFPVGEHAL